MNTASAPLAPSPLTSLAGRAAHAFTIHAMLQGFQCHTRGVELAVDAADRVRARVRSKRVHDVELRADQGRLIVACSCPSRSAGLDGCKHAWAALLEVDRQGALDPLRASRRLLRVAGADGPSAAPRVEGAPATAAPGAPPTSASRTRKPKKSATPNTKESAAEAAAPRRQAGAQRARGGEKGPRRAAAIGAAASTRSRRSA